MVVVLYPKFRSPEWRPVRAAMFVAMGLSAVVPVMHGLKLYGVAQLEQQIGLSWLVGQGVLYVLGAGLYAVRELSRMCMNRGLIADYAAGALSGALATRCIRHMGKLASDLSCACVTGSCSSSRWLAESFRL